MKKPHKSQKSTKSPAKRAARTVATARRARSTPQPAAQAPAPESFDEGDEKGAATRRPDEMDGDLLEFVKAIDHYKREHRRQFPSWGEVLHVLKSLGFKRSA
jgi:hypothetical protein